MSSRYEENDGPWGDGQAVEVRFPVTDPELPEDMPDAERLVLLKQERDRWPWLMGEILGQCGPGEWEVVVYDDRLAQLEDGSPAPAGTPPQDLRYPTCFRDGSEIREPQREAEEAILARLDAELEAGQ